MDLLTKETCKQVIKNVYNQNKHTLYFSILKTSLDNHIMNKNKLKKQIQRTDMG